MKPEKHMTRPTAAGSHPASGEFVELGGERYYVIRDVDRMPPFLVSVISSDDHWLFVSSAGGLTAGRVSPDTALFPYIAEPFYLARQRGRLTIEVNPEQTILSALADYHLPMPAGQVLPTLATLLTRSR